MAQAPGYTTNQSPGTIQPQAPQSSAASPMTNPDGSMNWENLANNLGPTVIGGAGTYLSGQQEQNSTNKAVGYAGYKPTTISGPGGSIGSTTNPDGSINYNVSGVGSDAMNGLGQFSNNASGAGSDVLSAFKNFDPNAYAQDQYNSLASLAAPKNTDDTQAMLNYEQASGRGGLTQNGQLGDLGGLDLSQSLADTNMRMQAQTLASQRQAQLASTASTLGGAGTTALGGVSQYNSGLMDMLRTAMTGSSGQATAGNNQAQMINDTGKDRADQTGNLTAARLQGLLNSGGGAGNILSKLISMFKGGAGSGSGGGAGGSGGYTGDTNSDGSYNGGAFDGGAPLYDPSTGGYPGGNTDGLPNWTQDPSTPTDNGNFADWGTGTGDDSNP